MTKPNLGNTCSLMRQASGQSLGRASNVRTGNSFTTIKRVVHASGRSLRRTSTSRVSRPGAFMWSGEGDEVDAFNRLQAHAEQEDTTVAALLKRLAIATLDG